jgi:hypothetical protein
MPTRCPNAARHQSFRVDSRGPAGRAFRTDFSFPFAVLAGKSRAASGIAKPLPEDSNPALSASPARKGGAALRAGFSLYVSDFVLSSCGRIGRVGDRRGGVQEEPILFLGRTCVVRASS